MGEPNINIAGLEKNAKAKDAEAQDVEAGLPAKAHAASSSSSSTSSLPSELHVAESTYFSFTRKTSPWVPHPEDFQRVATAHYPGSGTEEDPYVINWIEDDAENPQLWPSAYKWALTALVAIATLAVGFCSSAYSGAMGGIMQDFGAQPIVVTLGISLFVLGFALGPLVWAPFSEVFGRRPLYIYTYLALTAFNAGTALAPNITALLVLRFFAGAFGSSPLTNAGGSIADMFAADQRGLALSLFAAAPFMGPVLGPVVSGFTAEAAGWRWVMWVMTLFTGVLAVVGIVFLPETYAPVMLRQRAARLSLVTNKTFRSKFEKKGGVSLPALMKTSLTRPWALLFREPIVFALSIFMAIVYGIMYMLFGAYPIIFAQGRGWSTSSTGLAFCGIAVGMLIAVVYNILDNRRYVRVAREGKAGRAPPEARLPPAIIGAAALPIGLFWFAWTNAPSIHWAVCIAGTVPFGFGMVLVFVAANNYLIDAYLIYAASVLAGSSVLRSLFGAVFPLFTPYMYDALGIHWASSLPAFLALACLPFPIVFYKYGATIRKRCRYAAEADALING